ncbi:MAG: IclR family transcriptional regulator [Egibacteraceae bacterium]
MSSPSAERGTLGTVRNATVLLQLLSAGPAFQQLTELAKQSGMSLPTVHRLLKSMARAGLVEQHPQSARYSLGPELVRLSERYLGRHPVVSTLAPYLVDLRNATKATVLVALLVRGSVVYVDRIDGEDVGGVYRTSHRVHSAFETASGRILLARCAPEAWDEAIEVAAAAGIEPADRSPHDYTKAQREEWAAQEYLALSDPQLPDFTEFAVPVVDQHNEVRAALSAMVSAEILTDEALTQRVTRQLLRAANAVRQAMGNA